ncbi:hypothetical protein VIGAN_01527700 [Vigna angularis var. angularis]|uniref:Carrier domain-containing protein n=1 Tax=Vigna angularis var. angularis TaxID=157739 RepID=A0A0S3R9L2_PHAAN|nr:hypothetical protein VIGAN_01527700 [Vigna angularis var. angularis]
MASFTSTSFCLTSFNPTKTLVPGCRISNPGSVFVSLKGRTFPPITLQSRVPRFQIACAAKPETVEKVCDIVKKQLALPDGSAVTGESKFSALGADSLDTVLLNIFVHSQHLFTVYCQQVHASIIFYFLFVIAIGFGHSACQNSTNLSFSACYFSSFLCYAEGE